MEAEKIKANCGGLHRLLCSLACIYHRQVQTAFQNHEHLEKHMVMLQARMVQIINEQRRPLMPECVLHCCMMLHGCYVCGTFQGKSQATETKRVET